MENQNSSMVKWVSLSIVAAAILVSGAIIYTKPNSGSNTNTNNNTNPDQQQQQQNQQSADISKVKVAGEPFYGNQNAPVTIAVWTDYQCPFCQKLEQESITKIISDYVNSGKVKIVFKDWAFLGQDSQSAGIFGRAVWEASPDKFYKWHKAMFDNQGQENSGWATKAKMDSLATSVGIDASKVDQLVAQKTTEYQKMIDDDKAEGTSFGINGTPGTIVDHQLIVGSQPYPTFKSAIDALLK